MGKNKESSQLTFPSRRSAVMGLKGAIATSQPLAVQAGIAMLLSGGNAVDAAVAAAAVLTVVEPMNTGLGGDGFALVYHADSNRVDALNASGTAPQAATVEAYRRKGFDRIPESGIFSVTVPGMVDGWAELLNRYGTKGFKEILTPAIDYAENGFPVSEIISLNWHRFADRLVEHPSATHAYLPAGRPPRPGEVFRHPNLANSLKRIASGGRDEFYQGELADRIAAFSASEGGFLTRKDLMEYKSKWVSPITTKYRGFDVCEMPPNTIGLAVLIALNILEGYDIEKMGFYSELRFHTLIEAIKLSFADIKTYVADPDQTEIPLQGLLSKEYAGHRRKTVGTNAAVEVSPGDPHQKGETVYIAAVDSKGNAVSLINSLFYDFGAGLVVDGTGICLQNRGTLFSLDPSHLNCIAPGKRPLHTLIPGLVLKGGRLFMSFGLVGGWMQPQAHVQILSNMIDLGMGPQAALDAPRVCYTDGRRVAIEKGLVDQIEAGLSNRGHEIVFDLPEGFTFGGGQVIVSDSKTGSLIAGSDPRKDGCAAAI